MKLKNKKTGEILEDVKNIDTSLSTIEIHYLDNGVSRMETCKSFKDFLEEWEDYEELDEYWFINASGEISSIYEEEEDEEDTKASKQIGNYFKTKEEAEKAVEKLKAWKRLKDIGFRFDGGDDACISYRIDQSEWYDKLDNDFDLLFGGEE